MKIFLVGLPGSGKSTLGKSLASALHILYVDLDSEIEKQEGKSVKVIFEEKGEDYFRSVERDQLARWCATRSDFVMATGGGAPCFHSNMDVMNEAGKTVFIDESMEVIIERMMKSDLSKRPLLASENREALATKINTLRSQRLIYYQQAQLTFTGKHIVLEEMIKELSR